MISNSHKQALHLDKLRKQKHLKITELCEGICNERQFSRYTSGVNIISLEKLEQFCERLEISINDFFYSLFASDRMVYSSLKEVYDLIVDQNYDLANATMEKCKKLYISDVQNQRFIDYLTIRLEYLTGMTNTTNTLISLKDKCNFDKLTRNQTYDFVDILYLQFLSQLEAYAVKNKALDVLIKALSSKEDIYISSENKNIFPSIYANVSNILGRKRMIDECLDMTIRGIEFCQKTHAIESITSLYYTNMLCHQYKNNYSKAKSSAIKCLSACLVLDDTKILKQYYQLIKDDLNMEPSTLFTTKNIINNIEKRE